MNFDATEGLDTNESIEAARQQAQRLVSQWTKGPWVLELRSP